MVDDLPEGPLLRADGLAERWGVALDAGFVAVPNMLVKAQTRLGITAIDMVVLLNIIMHWWHRDRRPSPTSATIAKRSGLAHRTVQRSLQKMEADGLILRIRVAKDRTEYSLEGLKNRLEYYARQDVWFRPELVTGPVQVSSQVSG